ncbi:MAG: SH3 domain-containing protein [Nitrospinales bacterium]
MSKPSKYFLIQTLFLAGTFLFTNSVFAETVYVKRSGTKLQATGSAKSKVLKKLGQGTALEVSSKKGKFYEVTEPGGKKGWVFKFKLTSKKPSGGGSGLSSVVGERKVADSGSASGSSIRGLSPVSEKHAQQKGISQTDINAVKQMESVQISSSTVDQFLSGRKLGEYAE